jgi:hypothetical protein
VIREWDYTPHDRIAVGGGNAEAYMQISTKKIRWFQRGTFVFLRMFVSLFW